MKVIQADPRRVREIMGFMECGLHQARKMAELEAALKTLEAADTLDEVKAVVAWIIDKSLQYIFR